MNTIIKAILFDFDGVILDSANIKTDAFLELFANYPQHRNAILKYHLDNQGISRFKKFEWIYKNLLLEDLTSERSEMLGEQFSAIVKNKILQAPHINGILDFLEYLKYNTACKSYVISGTPDNELNEIIKERKLSYFEEIWGSSRSKTESIIDILSRNAWQPDEALFLGDAITDHKAATETGVPFIAVFSESMQHYWTENHITPLKDLAVLIQDYNYYS